MSPARTRLTVLIPPLLGGVLGAAVAVAVMTARAVEAPSTSALQPGHAHRAEVALGDICTSTDARSMFQRDMDVGMSRMMSDMHAPGYSGNVDVDFLAMMVPHHEGAVDMARLVLQHGRDPATRMLAEEIIAGQRIEIESMQRRLILLRGSAGAGTESDFPALGGTRGPS